jgi:crotonobetainyl-CoA:carnitine CoA-transferase CaiB-like acyl-CoA transferase
MADLMTDTALPLHGIRVLEFTHMVAGPSAGLILADLGADVIKIEPTPGGDKTRVLTGAGIGFFSIMNRNKRSVMLDLKSTAGLGDALALVDTADVMIENFRPGAMAALGLGADALITRNPRLIYGSVKGFLSGPYEARAALDEVVQMMGGLAYMTGLPGRPMRAGSSVIDIMSGMFTVIAIQAALLQRETTGRGQHVSSGLYETCTMLMAQHMMQTTMTGQPVAPMSNRQPAWGVYDVFDCCDGQLFLGVVTDTQWRGFCEGFGLAALGVDPRLTTNNDRRLNRQWLIPALAKVIAPMTRAAFEAKAASLGLPYAPIATPEDLFTDPHLLQSGGLLPITLVDGSVAQTPGLPVEMDGRRFGIRRGLPQAGEHTDSVLAEVRAARARRNASGG